MTPAKARLSTCRVQFNDLCAKHRNYDLGLILDIVPNRMAASHEKPW